MPSGQEVGPSDTGGAEGVELASAVGTALATATAGADADA
jgi:hypothetical protein